MKRRVLTVGSLLPQSQANKTSYKYNTDTLERSDQHGAPLIGQQNNPLKPKHQMAPKGISQRVRVSQNGAVFSIKPVRFQTVLNAAHDQGQSIDFKCTKGTCGRCEVHILEGMSLLSPPNHAESVKLTSSLNTGYRLTCQAVFKSE